MSGMDYDAVMPVAGRASAAAYTFRWMLSTCDMKVVFLDLGPGWFSAVNYDKFSDSPGHHNSRRTVIVPAAMSFEEWSAGPARGRQLLAHLTNDGNTDGIVSGIAIRILGLSTVLECELELHRRGELDWEDISDYIHVFPFPIVGHNSTMPRLPPDPLGGHRIPVPSARPGTSDDLAHIQVGLLHIQHKLESWGETTSTNKRIFQDYAGHPSVASHRSRHYPSAEDRRCRLLELPAELRNRIFALSMPAGQNLHIFPPRSQAAAALPNSGARYAKEPGILLASKQIRAESAPVYYNTNKVFIPVMPFFAWDHTQSNILNHVKGLLPMMHECLVCQHFSLPLIDGFNWRHDVPEGDMTMVAIAVVHIQGREFSVKVYVQLTTGDGSGRKRGEALNDCYSREMYETLVAETAQGVENLVEAVEMAMPTALKRMGEVEYFAAEASSGTVRMFEARCLPWWLRW